MGYDPPRCALSSDFAVYLFLLPDRTVLYSFSCNGFLFSLPLNSTLIAPLIHALFSPPLSHYLNPQGNIFFLFR